MSAIEIILIIIFIIGLGEHALVLWVLDKLAEYENTSCTKIS